MDYETKSSLYNLLRQLEDSLRERPGDLSVKVDFRGWEDGDRSLRLSESGKKARYLAHKLQGTPQEIPLARSRITMDLGHIIHEYLREVLNNSPDYWEVVRAEDTVSLIIGGEEVEGHFDLLLRDVESGATFLIDVKGITTYGFKSLDPRRLAPENKNSKGNPPNINFWKGGDFVFDAESFIGDPFQEKYLYQIESYLEALEGEGLEPDACLFVMVNRDTGHIAVGIWDPTPETRASIRAARDTEFTAALEDPNPSHHPTCNPAAVGGSLELGCQYCGFKHECFALEVTTFRGSPSFKIKDIR